MKLPLDLRFIGLATSPALEEAVRDKVAQLERVTPEVLSCHVTIEQDHKHQHQGRPFVVRIDLTVPGHEITVNRVQNEDAYVALRDAFDAARRQLDAAVRMGRGEVKQRSRDAA